MLSNGTYKCKCCHDTGMILVTKVCGADVYGEDKPLVFTQPCPKCNGGHEIQVQKVRQRANIPHSFYASKLSDFDWAAYKNEKDEVVDLSKQKQFVDSFVDNFPKWQEQGLGLYFWSGIRGTGKTYLASCVCNELMARYHMVTKFVSASDLINLDQEGKKNNYEKNPIDVLSECMLLVIDDLGQQKTGEAYLDDILFRIIDHRYQNKLVTMITSNIELKKLRLDDRVSDRLNKMCQPIPLPDISFRQKESNQNKRDFFKDMGLM